MKTRIFFVLAFGFLMIQGTANAECAKTCTCDDGSQVECSIDTQEESVICTAHCLAHGNGLKASCQATVDGKVKWDIQTCGVDYGRKTQFEQID